MTRATNCITSANKLLNSWKNWNFTCMPGKKLIFYPLCWFDLPCLRCGVWSTSARVTHLPYLLIIFAHSLNTLIFRRSIPSKLLVLNKKCPNCIKNEDYFFIPSPIFYCFEIVTFILLFKKSKWEVKLQTNNNK